MVQYMSLRKTIQTDHRPQVNLRTCKFNDGNQESMLWRLANDLLGKVRHKNHFLLLVRRQELLDVLDHPYPFMGVGQQALIQGVGVNYRDSPGPLSHDLVRHTERN